MRRKRSGFTLLELLVVVLIIAIFSGLIVAAVSGLRSRAQRLRCANNLRNLSVAANLYVQQNGGWPQIASPDPSGPREVYADAWITALQPFGATRETWICPTIQNLMHNPDYSTAETARIDYIPMPFDDKPATPHKWPRQPWFVEIGDVHGNGNLIIFTDGSISDLKTVLQQAGGGRQ